MSNSIFHQKNRIVTASVFITCVFMFTSTSLTAACDSPEHRAFDFWLGDWDVKTPDGKVAGSNSITKHYNDCVLREQYKTPKGFSGESFNTYDVGRKVWHQTWIDNANSLLLLEGGIRDGSMVLEGKTTSTDAKVTLHRITFTPNDDGSVRQFWQSTNAKGEWETAFDGIYTRK
ncbi:MAG: DUF1579 family protein [Gammaproteobacteria bacterium]|jgi:hypothetical protein|nr:DUF1579 family protein [Gammaproteobacteria bacterium]